MSLGCEVGKDFFGTGGVARAFAVYAVQDVGHEWASIYAHHLCPSVDSVFSFSPQGHSRNTGGSIEEDRSSTVPVGGAAELRCRWFAGHRAALCRASCLLAAGWPRHLPRTL